MSELTPEEREKIYKEEKAKKEVQEKKKPKSKIVPIGCAIILGFIALIVILPQIFKKSTPQLPSSSESILSQEVEKDISETTFPLEDKLEIPNIKDLWAKDTLEVESFRFYTEYGYSYVEGRVENLTNKSLEGVKVIAEFFDKNNNFVKSEDTFIDYNPILPNQISPFKIITTSDPAITHCNISFKFFIGGTIDFHIRQTDQELQARAQKLNLQAWELVEANKDLDEAIKLAIISLTFYPTANAYDTLGWACYLKGQYNNAKKFVSKACELESIDSNKEHLQAIEEALNKKKQ